MRSVQGMFGCFIEMVSTRGVTSIQDQAELLYILDPIWKPPPQPTPVMIATPVTILGTPVTQTQQAPQQPTVPLTTGTPVLPGPPLPALLPPGAPVGPAPGVPPAPASSLGPAHLGPTVFKPWMEAQFDGSSEIVSYFLVVVDEFLRCWRHQFVNEEECIKYISSHFDGNATQWYVYLYRMGAPELTSLPLFM